MNKRSMVKYVIKGKHKLNKMNRIIKVFSRYNIIRSLKIK